MKSTLLLLTMMPICLLGQETLKIVDKKQKEIYFVLKSDTKIRHGSYQKLGCNDSTQAEGFYKNGVKDSLWTGWPEKGMYSEGRKIGVWEYYNFNGELEQKYDHSKKELLYWRFYGTPDSLYYVFSGNDTIILKLDRPPLYIGGVAVMTEPILSHIKIPRFTIWLRKNHRQIIINFTVDSSGKTSNYRVSKGISRGFDRQVLKAVQNLPADWLPAIRDGRPVTVEHCYYINYTLVRKHKDHP